MKFETHWRIESWLVTVKELICDSQLDPKQNKKQTRVHIWRDLKIFKRKRDRNVEWPRKQKEVIKSIGFPGG